MKSHLINTTALLLLALNLASCVRSEKFVGISTIGSIESGIEDPQGSEDVLCSDAKDIDACLALSDSCQPAYENILDDRAEKKFKACIDNPVVIGENPPLDPVTPVVIGENPPLDPVTPVVIGENPTLDPVAPGAGENSSQDPVPAPELSDIKNCGELDSKYLSTKGHGQPKVIICHHSCQGSHTIIIACPALKAHLKHQGSKDYLGACRPE